MSPVLGLDLSTQSLTALIIDPAAGKILREKSVNFGADLPHYGSPHGFLPNGADGQVHADPRMWVEALDLLLENLFDAEIPAAAIAAISSAGQQHGSVYLAAGWENILRQLQPQQRLSAQTGALYARATAPIWMDSSTSRECREIEAAVGGAEAVNAISGSVAIERFSGPQVRRFFRTDPSAYAATARIHVVSSFLTCLLTGQDSPLDYGDGAGMNLLDLCAGEWSVPLCEATAPGLRAKLPTVVPSATIAGTVSSYWQQRIGLRAGVPVVTATGDNPSSLIGMGASRPGRVVISLGTSDTLFAAMADYISDPHGYGHVFGNPAGGCMALICFKNGSLARERVRDQHGLSWDDFGPAGLGQTPFGNHGNGMLPFFEPEITPRMDAPCEHYFGSADFCQNPAPPAVQRACVEGQMANMRLQSDWLGITPDTVLLTGGASRNDGIAQVAADIFQAKVERLETPSSVALGAAMRAAASGLGMSLAELEDKFCRPLPGLGLRPSVPPNETEQVLEKYRGEISEMLKS